MHGRDVRLGDCNEYRRCPLLVVHCESVISDFSECQHFYDQRVTTKYEQTRASMSYLYGHISLAESLARSREELLHNNAIAYATQEKSSKTSPRGICRFQGSRSSESPLLRCRIGHGTYISITYSL
jgi:hypothetical protein